MQIWPFAAASEPFACVFACRAKPFCVREPYSRIAAISEAFKIVNTNVLEAEQRKQLQAIRAHLDRLEDGGAQVIDV